MSAVGINDNVAWARYEGYRRALDALAVRGASSGKPGAWLELRARIDGASDRMNPSAGCDVALHATQLELSVWGHILKKLVRDERHEQLEQAILAVAEEETRDLDELHELSSMAFLCPSVRPIAHTPDRPEASIEELVLIRRIKEASRRRTVGALEQALRSWCRLATATSDGSEHVPCDAFDVLTVRAVLIRALAETIPHVRRQVLAVDAQRSFYRLQAPDEPVPEFLDQAPRHMTQGDAVWAFSPAWRGVAFRAGRTDHDGNPGEWLIEDLESIARRWEAEEAARVQRQKEWLERRVRDARSSGNSN